MIYIVNTISEFENYLDLLSKVDPSFGNLWKRTLVNTYDEFIKCLYEDIDQIIDFIQESRELRQDDSEDRLTIEIVGNLRRLSYTAFHDPKMGGHIDLFVQKKNFKWMGEAKIYHGPMSLLGGFNQLCTRYTIGDVNQNNGGLLVYLKDGDAKSLMEKWKGHLTDQNFVEFKFFQCQSRPLAFYSEHKHPVSGNSFTVRHMPLILFFEPQDKSGLARSKTKDKLET